MRLTYIPPALSGTIHSPIVLPEWAYNPLAQVKHYHGLLLLSASDGDIEAVLSSIIAQYAVTDRQRTLVYSARFGNSKIIHNLVELILGSQRQLQAMDMDCSRDFIHFPKISKVFAKTQLYLHEQMFMSSSELLERLQLDCDPHLDQPRYKVVIIDDFTGLGDHGSIDASAYFQQLAAVAQRCGVACIMLCSIPLEHYIDANQFRAVYPIADEGPVPTQAAFFK